MRFIYFCVICAAMGLFAGCGQRQESAPDALFRLHFIGSSNILADPQAVGPKEFWTSSEGQAFVSHLLDRLAAAPYLCLRTRLDKQTNNFAPLIRPLLQDCLRHEFRLEARDNSTSTPEWALAINVGQDRVEVWRTNLSTVLSAWTGAPVSNVHIDNAQGWEIHQRVAPNRLRFLQAGQWIVMSAGQDEFPLGDQIVRLLLDHRQPVASADNNWCSIQADWPRLERWIKWPAGIKLPPMNLKMAGRRTYIVTEAEFDFPQPRDWNPEPWRVPTNSLREPLISFTAARGLRNWLSEMPLVQRQPISKVPDQLFCWALGDTPFQTFAAAPMPDASNVLCRLASSIISNYYTPVLQAGMGLIQFQTNDQQIIWKGLPFVFPCVKSVREPAGEYLMASLFGDAPFEPASSELLAQLNHPNLMFFDWELTGERLVQWRYMVQTLAILQERPLIDRKSPTGVWIDSIAGKAGNSVTEITQPSPAQLKLVRSSSVGFTSVELAFLANWLESSDFPLGSGLSKHH